LEGEYNKYNKINNNSDKFRGGKIAARGKKTLVAGLLAIDSTAVYSTIITMINKPKTYCFGIDGRKALRIRKVIKSV